MHADLIVLLGTNGLQHHVNDLGQTCPLGFLTLHATPRQHTTRKTIGPEWASRSQRRDTDSEPLAWIVKRSMRFFLIGMRSLRSTQHDATRTNATQRYKRGTKRGSEHGDQRREPAANTNTRRTTRGGTGTRPNTQDQQRETKPGDTHPVRRGTLPGNNAPGSAFWSLESVGGPALRRMTTGQFPVRFRVPRTRENKP